MAYPKIYHPILGIVKRSTDKAILLVITDPEALTDEDATIENWIPKSQILNITPMKDVAGNSEVRMSEWIIGQKDLKRFIRSTHYVSSSVSVHPVVHPAVPTTPPAHNWMDDMDDDIPY